MKLTFNRTSLLAIATILVFALNLRAPFTAVAPVLEQIMNGLELTSASAGFLTALPLISFAIVSPLSAPISKKLGLHSSLILALTLIALGIVIRSIGVVPLLYVGTIFVGAGIAMGNVLLPVVVKLHFPGRIAVLTSLYTFSMGIAATVSSSLMVPISQSSISGLTGWQLALSATLIFPIAAIVLWLPQNRKEKAKQSTKVDASHISIRELIKKPIAWQVTLALGLNSFTFYSLAGWLPTILNDQGYSELQAGYMYGLLQFSTVVPGLLLIPVLRNNRGQKGLIAVTSLMVVAGIVGLLYLPQYAILWIVVFGSGNCSTFIVALSFVGLRTANASDAAQLSGMSQTVGYALAGVGPTLLGYLHSVTGSWFMPLAVVGAVGMICSLNSVLAAREIVIEK